MLASGTIRSRHTTPATPHFSARRANSSRLIAEIASNAISKFFRLYTLSISEWTFLAALGLIQSASLLGR